MVKIDLSNVSDEQFAEGQKIYADIIARYYGDPDFKAKLEGDPTSVLREAGMQIPDGVSVKLHVNTEQLLHVVLPEVD